MDYKTLINSFGTPVYVRKTNDAQIVPKSGMKKWILLRRAVGIVLLIIILASLIFRENLYDALSLPVRLLLLALVISVICINTDERVPTPVELWFFDDFLVLYHEKHYHDAKHVRMEFDKILYKDIKKCQYRAAAQRINFYGIAEGIWYEYDGDKVSDEPVYHKTTDSIRYLYTMFMGGLNIVGDIEHCTLVKVERS